VPEANWLKGKVIAAQEADRGAPAAGFQETEERRLEGRNV